ncbi:MAG: aminoglycoside phosphotransferase [Betaproteobacteria bacterium RBG_16_66_20]|nr:MAG: aminoglycoside phosphotransferase [Betaproteobacteria bacterium RBG_16_66_20]
MSEQFTGVKPVEERHRIDIGRLEEFLKAQLEGLRGPLQLEQFKGGQSNPTYRVTAGGKRYALRRKPPGKLLPSAHAVEREYKVIKALHGVGFPVPRPYLLCEDDSVIGTAFYVMDCVEGRVLWDQSLPGMSRAERRAIWEELNRVIALLHSVDYKAVGLEDFGRAGSYIERQVGRWSKQYLASETEKIEAMDKLIAWLPKNVPATGETTIVHGDYRLDNTVFHPTEAKMLAVLDWELSTLGDPLADFSYHCMSWHIPPGKFRGIEGLPLEELGIPGEREYVEMYFKRTGRKGVSPSVWDYYMAYNLFRIAAICQGIAKRVVEGTAASEHARDAGARARPLAELGWAQVEKILKRAA